MGSSKLLAIVSVGACVLKTALQKYDPLVGVKRKQCIYMVVTNTMHWNIMNLIKASCLTLPTLHIPNILRIKIKGTCLTK